MHAELQEPAASKVGTFIDDLERLVYEVKTGTTTSVINVLCGQIGLNGVLASLDANRPAGLKAANSDWRDSTRMLPHSRRGCARCCRQLRMKTVSFSQLFTK